MLSNEVLTPLAHIEVTASGYMSDYLTTQPLRSLTRINMTASGYISNLLTIQPVRLLNHTRGHRVALAHSTNLVVPAS